MTSPTVVRRAVATAASRVIAQRSGLVVSGIFYLMVTAILAALWSTAALSLIHISEPTRPMKESRMPSRA